MIRYMLLFGIFTAGFFTAVAITGGTPLPLNQIPIDKFAIHIILAIVFGAILLDDIKN